MCCLSHHFCWLNLSAIGSFIGSFQPAAASPDLASGTRTRPGSVKTSRRRMILHPGTQCFFKIYGDHSKMRTCRCCMYIHIYIYNYNTIFTYIYIYIKSAFRTLQLYILVQLGIQMQTYKHNDLYLIIYYISI